MNSSSSIFPGDYVASAKDFTAGHGLYSKNGDLRSCIVGIAQAEEKNDKVAVARPTIHIQTPKVAARDYVVRVEDVLLCKVTRVNYNQAYVDIFVRQPDSPVFLPFPAKGVIRREDIREKEIDKVVTHDFFKPQDAVKAVVISLGDSKTYFLSTARAGLGVIVQTAVDDTKIAV